MSAVENRQAEIKGKVTLVLATAAANTKALEELKSMFCRYMEKIKDKDKSSPSVNEAVIEN
jgi:hypothetical protein